MTQVLQRTVLFADLRGSTSMYETLGNADATAVVTRSVALLARIVAAHGGQVVKTLGDGLMAVFETPAEGVAAADEMHDSLARIGMAEDTAPEAANDSQRGDDMAEERRADAAAAAGGAAQAAGRPRSRRGGRDVGRRLRRRGQRRRPPARPRRRQRDAGDGERGRAARRVGAIALSQPRQDAAARPRRAGARAPAGSHAPLRRHRGDRVRRHADPGLASPRASASSGST